MGTDWRTDMCKNNDHYPPWLWVGLMDQKSHNKIFVRPLCLLWTFFFKFHCLTSEVFFCEFGRGKFRKQLIHSANPKSRSVGIIVFAHVRPSVRPHISNVENQNNRKQCSLLAWPWVWPIGSLMTPVLFLFVFQNMTKFTFSSKVYHSKIQNLLKILNLCFLT